MDRISLRTSAASDRHSRTGGLMNQCTIAALFLLALLIAPAAVAQTFNGTGTGGIPDSTGGPANYGTPLDITFNVASVTGVITNISLSTTLTHSYIGDLDVVLAPPGVTPGAAGSFVIFSRVRATTAGSFGDSSNLNGTYVFNDASSNNLWTAAAAGGGGTDITATNYRTSVAGPTTDPAASTNFTAAFSGLTTPQINGNWTLRIRDGAGGDTGSVTAAALTLTIAVPTPPTITSANSTTFTVGVADSFQVTATGSPAPTYSVSGALPTGVTFSSSGLLSGTPAGGTAGTYPLVITATNGTAPDATQNFTLTVVATPPTITSANSTTFNQGVAGNFAVTATGTNPITFAATGALPAGVSFSAAGVLSGTPANGTAGSYPLVITAMNGVAPNDTQNFTLTVNATAPTITSANSTSFAEITPGSFTVTTTGSPTMIYSITSGALPAGLSLNSATGVISGSPGPGTAGSYPFTLNASNGQAPDATQAFTLTVTAVGSGVPATNGVMYTWENLTSGAIANNSCPSGGATHSFVITDSFLVGGHGSIAIGVEVDHNNRGDLVLTLTAPDGSTAALQTNVGGTANDLNVMYTSNNDTANTVLESPNDADPLNLAGDSVHYRRLVGVAALDTFYTGTSVGTWTLRVCDSNGGTSGTLLRSRLALLDISGTTSSSVCGNNVAFDWGSNGNDTTFTSINIGGVTVSQDSTSGEPPNDIQPSYRTYTGQRGAHFGYYQFRMDTTGDGELSAERATFLFDTPVVGLNFALGDIDLLGTGAAYEDQVRINAFGPNGDRIPYQMTIVDSSNLRFAGDWLEADVGIADTSDGGNINYQFDVPISRVEVQYVQSNEPQTDIGNQWVVITDFGFCAFDFGDAPSSYGVLARHAMGDVNTLHLGANPPDGEDAAAPGASANGDGADEDGVASFPTYVATGMTCGSYNTSPGEYCTEVVVNNTTTSAAQLVGFFDFSGDGDFNDAGERSSANLGGGTGGAADGTWTTGNIAASSGSQTVVLVWSGFGQPTAGQTYARIRLSSDPLFLNNATPPASGNAVNNGEAEDYLIGAGTTPVTVAKFDAQRLDGNRVRVAWSTASEAGTLGFYVAESSGRGSLNDLNAQLVASVDSSTMTPQDYTLELTTAANELYLVEIDIFGKRTEYGPYAVGQSYGDSTRIQPYDWTEVGVELATARSSADSELIATAGSVSAVEARVSQTGIQRIEYDDLVAAGANWAGTPASMLSVRAGQTSVSARLVGGDSFGPGTAIEFVGNAVEDSLYTAERVYRISIDGIAESSWQQISAAPLPGASASKAPHSVRLDQDRHYNFSASGGDPWYFDSVTRTGVSAAKSWDLLVPQGADLNGAASLSMDIWGALDYSGAGDDHRYRVLFNGVALGEASFDGLRSRSLRFNLPPSALRLGANQVQLELLQTNYPVDRIMVDSIELRFDAPITAELAAEGIVPANARGTHDQILVDAFEDHLAPALPCGTGCRQLRIDGFASSDIVVLQDSNVGIVELTDYELSQYASGYSIRLLPPLGVDAGGDDQTSNASGLLYAATNSTMARPPLRPAANYAHPLNGAAAAYLAIVPPGFADGLTPLLNARNAEGLSARSVELEAVYQHYSDGVIDPEAIRAFVRDAYAQLGTRYVLLAGGDTYDYFDRTGLGSVSLIPTIYRATHEVVFYAPVDGAFADVDEDGRPDLAIGRLPARTRAELDAMVAKTLSYGDTPRARSSLFAAERFNPSEKVDYGSISDQLIAAMDPGWLGKSAQIYLDQYASGSGGVNAARQDLFDAINAGQSLISYYGHAAPSAWSRERLLQPQSLRNGLSNPTAPAIVTEFGCWGAYFVEPSYNTVGLTWLTPEDRGAAAMIASSALTHGESDRAIALSLLPALTGPGIRIGDALSSAQRQIWLTSPEATDVIMGMTLLGDPALMVNPR